MTDQTSKPYYLTLKSLRVLLFEALSAGRYLPPGTQWEKHHSGERLQFRERSIEGEYTGVLVLSNEITQEIIEDSVYSEHPYSMVVGATLNEAVHLGKFRVDRVKQIEIFNAHYWATFILENSTLITLGTPPSPCRLIGEVLNLHVAKSFVQSRICAQCYALNDYHSSKCAKCEQPLMATGRLGN